MLDLETAKLTGPVYRDKMCLIQSPSKPRTDETGDLCVKDMKFLAVDNISGHFEASGLIGLAP